MAINKGAVGTFDRIGNATRAGEGNAGPIQRQSEPMIFGAETLYEIDAMSSAKSPETEGAKGIDAFSESKRHQPRADFARLGENFARWIAAKPCFVAVRIKPVNFEAGPIFLASPTSAAFQKQEFHDDG